MCGWIEKVYYMQSLLSYLSNLDKRQSIATIFQIIWSEPIKISPLFLKEEIYLNPNEKLGDKSEDVRKYCCTVLWFNV